MTELVLGPMLRYAGTESATFWVETSAPCEVEILAHSTRTFAVEGHHYALLLVTDLEPATVTPYDVRLDGITVWPPEDGRPRPVVRTRANQRQSRLVFGSCRIGRPQPTRFATPWPEDLRQAGIDALWTYAKQLQRGETEWPDAVLLLGDQVYADEVSPATLDFIRSRRDTEQPPGEQIADFEEYTRLYRESWSDPDIRWLLSTVPTTMIFDDHDVHDDWNISWLWVQEMRERPWWEARITGAFMAYWIYQHLGNLSPPELAEEEMLELVKRDEDAGPRLRQAAHMWDRESAASRWAYYRDFGDTRLLVLDSRAARVLGDGQREMVDEEEWDWILDHSIGAFDHVIIASTLPVFMPRGIHHLQAWNEALCAGRLGKRVADLSERLRRAVDLEHWPAFNRSFERLCDWLRQIVRGVGDGPVPASILLLGGDVHCAYVSEVDLRTGDRACRVFQLTCSPFRNPLSPKERRIVRATASRASGIVFYALARLAGVDAPSVEWRRLRRETFDNSIGELLLDERAASVTIRRSPREGEDVERLVVMHTNQLTNGSRPAMSRRRALRPR
ncbi:MAG TPA: alkaline phosphatase D family protein [Gaiellaceae bacterium]|nr:alkaline phosphatase D family protein [Gaiellaceae bacterium]